MLEQQERSEAERPMTDDEASEAIKKWDDGDREIGHIEADGVLLDLLLALGYPKTVKAFQELKKWYA